MTKNIRKYKKFCAYCGVEYYGAKPFSKYCSDAHRVYYSNSKKLYFEVIEFLKSGDYNNEEGFVKFMKKNNIQMLKSIKK